MLPDIEVVSAKVHDAWMASKRAQGVTTRKAEDGEELMVTYEQLSEKAKQLDRGTVQAVYAAISALSETKTNSAVPTEMQKLAARLLEIAEGNSDLYQNERMWLREAAAVLEAYGATRKDSKDIVTGGDGLGW